MIIDNVDVLDFIPSQILEIIDKLNYVLNVIKLKKSTISKVAHAEKIKCNCPHCSSTNIVKNGHTKVGIQTYKCKDCFKRFNDLTGTVFEGTHLSYNQIDIFLLCFKDKVSLRKTAKRMKVDKNTVFLLRQKFTSSFKDIRKNTKLKGEVESDEIYKSINLKGTKPKNMPRASKHRTSKGTTTRGISSHKVCILSAIDEFDNMFLEIVGTGPITSDMVKKALTPKIGAISKLITDCKSSYESEAKINNWNLKQIKSKSYVDDEGNTLANINSFHSGLSTFLSVFRGVSTKHLQGYLDWYTFDKYLNFKFDESQQLKVILNNSVNNNTDINVTNMYNNYSGIDFQDVYLDYHYIPSRKN